MRAEKEEMEELGFEPRTFCMRNRHSTAELHPLPYYRYNALEGEFRRTASPHIGCLPRTTKIYVLSIFVATVTFNFPLIWERMVLPNEETGMLEVLPTALRCHDVYIKLYRLTLEFLVFKATPIFAFFILFLSLLDRVKLYGKRVRTCEYE